MIEEMHKGCGYPSMNCVCGDDPCSCNERITTPAPNLSLDVDERLGAADDGAFIAFGRQLRREIEADKRRERKATDGIKLKPWCFKCGSRECCCKEGLK